MTEIKTYKDLIVWQKSIDLVIEVYSFIKSLPNDEKFVLCDQMRRSAVSIPSNIAEGYERQSRKDYVRFLAIASGSCAELITQLEICAKLGYISKENALIALCEEISRMLSALIKKLQK